MQVFDLAFIRSALNNQDLLKVIEEGFVLYSTKKVVVPPVGHLRFEEPPGDVHIKYGYIRDDDFYVVKIASGFYDNPARGLPSGDGLMLVFDQKTGFLNAILLDEGHLTDIRTAIAGAIVAKYLAPKKVRCIGIVGTGVQARLQLRFLGQVVNCKRVIAWGRNPERLKRYKDDMKTEGWDILATTDIDEITQECNLIVTTTSSRFPLLMADRIKKGCHITAVGADTKEKHELDPALFSIADIVVVDSVDQCIEHGDTAHAIRAGKIQKEQLVELGTVIMGTKCQRQSDDQITVADLTGLAVQDIQIAKHVYRALSQMPH